VYIRPIDDVLTTTSMFVFIACLYTKKPNEVDYPAMVAFVVSTAAPPKTP
jgi:hypothetical protein